MTPRPVTVLLLAAGSPGDYAIIQGLRRSPRYDVTLHAADCDPLKGNLYLPGVDKAYVVPRYDAENYKETILGLVKSIGANVLISDLDEELPALSSWREELAGMGCAIVLPPEESLRICFDKWATYQRLKGNVPQPETVIVGARDLDEAYDLLLKHGKVILKPQFLRGGRGVDLAEDRSDLRFYAKRHARKGTFIVQQYMAGTEYNCSMLHDMTGRLIYCAVREKLETRLVKSNTIAARVIRNEFVSEQALSAVRDLGLNCGFNNVEIIMSDGLAHVIDVNGGRIAGQDMNLLGSGINQAELYLDLALGVPVEPIDVPVGVMSLKIKSDVIIRQGDLDGLAWVGVERREK